MASPSLFHVFILRINNLMFTIKKLLTNIVAACYDQFIKAGRFRIMKKLSSTAGILYTLAKIASVCCIVGACIIAAAAVLLFAFSDPSMIEFTGLDLGNLTFRLAETNMEMIKSTFLCEMLPAFVLLGYGWAVLRIILRILEPMKKGLPFDGSISAKMKSLCWLTIGGGVCSQLAGIAAQILLFKSFDFATLFLNEHITHVTLNLKFELGFVVLALIWYMLSCIFRYGEELQKQSDETL